MIEVTGLTRHYGSFVALEDVSFQVAESEIVGLLGLNGAGKSTTLKILAGLLAASDGRVRINGAPVEDDSTGLYSQIGFLPERPALYDDMTVENYLVHVGQLKGMSAPEAKRRVPEVVALCDLRGREHQMIHTLSQGYRKRVGIAGTIIHDPKLVILDEPISGLDPAQIVELRDVIRGLGKGRAVILSSHILSEISQTCDRILVVHDGRLVAQGTEAELSVRVGGTTRLHIEVRGAEDAFMEWLAGRDEIKHSSAQSAGEGLAAALIEIQDDAREALLAELIGAGFGLRVVEPASDELEEIFLGLTKKEASA